VGSGVSVCTLVPGNQYQSTNADLSLRVCTSKAVQKYTYLTPEVPHALAPRSAACVFATLRAPARAERRLRCLCVRVCTSVLVKKRNLRTKTQSLGRQKECFFFKKRNKPRPRFAVRIYICALILLYMCPHTTMYLACACYGSAAKLLALLAQKYLLTSTKVPRRSSGGQKERFLRKSPLPLWAANWPNRASSASAFVLLYQ
jgi:hypothetical protein